MENFINEMTEVKQINTLPNSIDINENVLKIWKQVFQDNDIESGDNFFDLGGDSITGVQIVTKIRNLYNVDLKLTELYGTKSVKKISVVIADKIQTGCFIKNEGSPNVLILEKSGTGTPVFFIHTGGGKAFSYNDLVHRIGPGHPYYAIEYPELKNNEEHYVDIRTLANRYIKDVKNVEPASPYILCGYSFGGNVAFEMALGMQKMGILVEKLILIESFPPVTYTAEPLADDQYALLFPLIVGMYTGIYSITDKEVVDKKYQGLSAPAIIKQMKDDRVLPITVPDEEAAYFFKVWIFNHRCLHRYIPDNKFYGPCYFLKAADIQHKFFTECFRLKLDTQEPYEIGWGNFIREAINVIEIPGNHFTALLAPQLEAVAREMRTIL